MVRHIKKLVTFLLIVILFIVSLNINFERNISKAFYTIANSNKRESSCVTGEGTVYYVSSRDLSASTIRDSASIAGSSLGTIDRCTQVKVYCTSNGYAKISKVTDKWIAMSSLSSTTPTGCGNSVYTTTTDLISFGSVDLTYVSYGSEKNDKNEMYRDKPGTVILQIFGINNVASDDQYNINVVVKNPSNEDVTNQFDINRTGVYSGTATFKLKMRNGIVYDEGQYTVTFTYGPAVISKTFELIGRYYDFTLNPYKVDTIYNLTPTNKENNWRVGLENLDPADIDFSKFKINIYNEKNDDVTNTNFNILVRPSNTDRYFKFVNNTGTYNRPQPGKYRVVIKYDNPEYTTARSGFTREFTFEMESRNVQFAEQSSMRTSYRFNRFDITVPYEIKIISKTDKTITFKEKNESIYETKTMSITDFMDMYRDFNNSDISFGSDNKTVIKYENITVSRYYDNKYTYNDSGTIKTATIEELENTYPGITSVININDAISGIKKFTFDSNGYVEYNAKGNKTIHSKSTQVDNKQVLSVTGGILKFVIRHSGFNPEDTTVMPTIKRSDGKVMTEQDGFRVIEQRYEDIESEFGYMYLTIEYDNTNSKEYTSTYTVEYKFDNVKTPCSFQFTLLDGEIDYYLMSTYDGHLTDPAEAINDIPPGNMRYEYYLGFYLLKSGLLMDSKPSASVNYKVYTEQIDCTDNSSPEACATTSYFYKEKEYILSLVNYKDNNVTFDITYDTQANNERFTLTLDQFRNKYADAYELLERYTFDSNTGNITGNNYQIKVKKYYNNAQNQGLVDYIDQNGHEVIGEAINDFSVKYPEYYGYLKTRYVKDEFDNIVNGRIKGRYRITSENGVKIVGEDVTNQFDFQVDNNPKNLDRAITIYPATEVDAGRYYVYVSYEGLMGVGYLNNSNDPVIDKENYPEMWNRNTHMTIIEYSDPVYDIEFADAIFSNSVNSSNNLYANIVSSGEFKFDTKYIYDFSKFSYKIEYKDGSNWIDKTATFNSTSKFEKDNNQIKISTIPGTTIGGNYRLVVEYDNNGNKLKEPKYYEFNVDDKYYGLIFDVNPLNKVTFAKNYSQTKEFVADGYYITNTNNIELKLVRFIDDDNIEEYIWDKNNKQFKKNGVVAFNYETIINTIDADTIDYVIRLTNVKDVNVESEYQLTAYYKEDNNQLSQSSIKFNVGPEQYLYTIGNEIPVVNSDGYSIKRDIYASYINYVDLDNINYVIYYSEDGNYIDVSSSTSTKQLFEITDYFPNTVYNGEYDGYTYTYKGVLNIAVKDTVALSLTGDYYIAMNYNNKHAEFEMSNLSNLFAWSTKLDINGKFEFNGEELEVNDFYLNINDITLDVLVNTPHEDNLNFIITKACLNGACTPSQEINYNNRFDVILNEKNHLVLKYKDNLSDFEKLEKGEYALVLYYNNSDYKINVFEVLTEYTKISFSDVLTSSDVNNGDAVPYLYKNKVGHIQIPVDIFGVTYDKTIISITDRNGRNDYSYAFTYNRAKFDNDHILELIYNPNSNIPAGDYNIMVYYTNADNEIVKDNVIVTMNEAYFNFDLGEPIYEPNPAIANADPYGEVMYDVVTDQINNISIPINGDDASTQKHVFANNVVITTQNNVDVTSRMFEVSARISSTSASNFILSIKYKKNEALPGTYKIKVSYKMNNHTITKTSYFVIADYEKDINIKNTEIITSTNDERIHNNIGGTFKINYDSIYDISVGDIAVNVMNSDNINVSDNFNFIKYTNSINVELIAKTPSINSGNYTVNIIYTDSNTGKVKTHAVNVKIYGYYKEIAITNMMPSSSTIYADLDNQFYTFNLNTANLTDTEIANMKARIYDRYGNIVSSSIAEDSVSNAFNVTYMNNGTYKINIIPFKAPVGSYYVELLLKNEDNDYNISNKLSFDINSTRYKIRLSPDSSITTKKIYNNDKYALYDNSNILLNYKFSSTYNNSNADYSIKIYSKGLVVKEFNNINLDNMQEFGVSYLISKMEIEKLDEGEYDVKLCLNGLPYDGMTINVSKYIPVSFVTVTLDGEIINENVYMSVGYPNRLIYYVEPSNATNKNIEFISTDDSIFKVEDADIVPISTGNAKFIVKNDEYKREINVIVDNRISSKTLVIDHDEKTIFISTTNVRSYTKSMLTNNLIGLSSDYVVKNKNNQVLNDYSELVGTGSTVMSGGNTYTVILIGDLNGDGKIAFGDVSYLFNIYNGSESPSSYVFKAAMVRKSNGISFGDVSKLFDYYRGEIDEI